MTIGRLQVPGTVIYDYELRSVEKPRELVVLLHGYGQSGSSMMKKFERALPADAALFAPNGPYPIPERTEEGYRVGFSWYFYNQQTDEYYIGMDVALKALKDGIRELGLSSLPTRVVGYSQGGYLAPFLALELSLVRQVVGISSRFLEEELLERGGLFSLGEAGGRLDAVHGTDDLIVDAQEARTSHQKLLARTGAGGRFLLLDGIGHKIVPALVDGLAELITAVKPG